MARVFADLTVIRIYWNGNTYTVRAEETKTTDKQKNEKYKASESHDPYAISFGESEYSIDVKNVDPAHKHLFIQLRELARQGKNKALFRYATYEYDQGVLTPMEHYDTCYVEEITRTDNKPFDVKIGALSRVYRNAQNKLI